MLYGFYAVVREQERRYEKEVATEVQALRENLEALVVDLNKAKPSASKGVYLQKITVSSTMGPGVGIEKASLSV